ncbi:hypothetical protein BC628DRAFT_157152 [Trametes gibbosa]|nr:hypothetical protein BC628DRAFT_157152 [Trametes gibbosa]
MRMVLGNAANDMCLPTLKRRAREAAKMLRQSCNCLHLPPWSRGGIPVLSRGTVTLSSQGLQAVITSEMCCFRCMFVVRNTQSLSSMQRGLYVIERGRTRTKGSHTRSVVSLSVYEPIQPSLGSGSRCYRISRTRCSRQTDQRGVSRTVARIPTHDYY